MNDLVGRTLPKPALSDQRRDRSRALYFVAASALATLIPLIFFAGFWIRAEFGKGQRDLEAMLYSRAAGLSDAIDVAVRSEIKALRIFAALPSADTDLAALREEALRIVGAMPDWRLIGVIDVAQAKIVLNTLRPPDADLGSFPDPALVKGLADSRKPLVQIVEARANPFVDEDAILIYYPISRDQGAPLVVATVLKLGILQGVAQDQPDQRILGAVLDGRQTILARTRSPETFVGRKASPEFEKLAGTAQTALFESRTLDGQAVSTAIVRSPLTGLTSVASMDRAEFDSASRRSVWATIVAGALSLTLAGILAVFLFHNVMEQRVSNERFAASRALGELDARLLATTQGALGEQRKAAHEREVLLREIYHRVKNNLQIVQSLLRLGSRDLTPEQREPFENAVRRIGAMARVHTLLYNSPDLASIDFRDYLQELVREASDAFGASERGIRANLDISSMRVPLDTAVPLAFIAVEVLTNAFRHAFPGGREGLINVKAYREGDTGFLIISDNGVGVPGKEAGKRSLGLTIAAKLAQQIGGHFGSPAPGESTFRLEFPIGKLPDNGFGVPQDRTG